MACAGDSRPARPAPSPSGAPQEAEQDFRIPRCEEFDRFAVARNRLKTIAQHAGQWAGLPMGIDGEEMVVHESYPWAHIFKRPEETPPEPGDTRYARRIRNVIWSRRYRCLVAIYERQDGKVESQPIIGSASSVEMEMRTMGCSVAWGIEQESNALKLLGTLLGHVAFKYYLMTGQFLETSARSGVVYMFRRLRPTIAIKENYKTGKLEVLCCMCLHPIGYYNESWAGAMCPTDDVIAHLTLMRGDEHMFWRYANQHPAGRPGSGI